MTGATGDPTPSGDPHAPGEPSPPSVASTETIAVLGAGTMGHGIAQVMAQAGHRVRLHDPADGAVSDALDRIRRTLEKGISIGKVTPEERDGTLTRLAAAPSLDAAVVGATVVVEAAPESLSLKQSIFEAVEVVAAPTALLATNTSSLSIGAVAEGLQHPERFVGLHFFNPVHIMTLVEVVYGPRTSEAVRERAVRLARGVGKEPIVVRDSPGFASSRLGVALGLEAMRMLEEGVASAADIDRAMELGYRHPMGPLRLTDLVGLDVRLGIAEYLHETLGQAHFAPPDILRSMVAEGKLGKKTGQGFHDWEGDG